MKSTVVCALVFVATGCGVFSFDVTEKVQAQTIPASSSVAANSPSALFETTLSIDADDLPRGSSVVDSVTLSRVTFNVLVPEKGNFDFVESVKLTISSPGNSSLADVEIAAGVPASGSTTLTLQPTGGTDLLPYVKSGAVIRAKAVGRQPAEAVTFDGAVVLTVHI